MKQRNEFAIAGGNPNYIRGVRKKARSDFSPLLLSYMQIQLLKSGDLEGGGEGDDRPKEKEGREPCRTGEGEQKVTLITWVSPQKTANSAPSPEKHE